MALDLGAARHRVTSVLVGASSVAQLEENVEAAGHGGFTAAELTAISRAGAGVGHQHLGRLSAPDERWPARRGDPP